LFHGHSFTANPLACTAALASIELLLDSVTQDSIHQISNRHREFTLKIRAHPKVKDIRQCGTILAIEWETGSGTSYFSDLRNVLYDFFLEKGILMRPLGNVIYILPPYCISDQDLSYIYTTIEEALSLYPMLPEN